MDSKAREKNLENVRAYQKDSQKAWEHYSKGQTFVSMFDTARCSKMFTAGCEITERVWTEKIEVAIAKHKRQEMGWKEDGRDRSDEIAARHSCIVSALQQLLESE